MRRQNLIIVVCLLMVTALLLLTQVRAEEPRYEKVQKRKDLAHQMAECARELGYSEDSVVIQEAKRIWWEADAEEKKLLPVQEEPYPVARQVWEYLTEEMGLPDIQAAGILGNFMAECGGQSLDLQPYIYSKGYYGLAMWYLPYTNGRLTSYSSVEE